MLPQQNQIQPIQPPNQIQRPTIINTPNPNPLAGQVRPAAPGQPVIIPNSAGIPQSQPGQNLQATLQASQALILQQQQQLAAVHQAAQQQLVLQQQQQLQAQQQQQQQQQMMHQQHQRDNPHERRGRDSRPPHVSFS